MAEPNVKTDEVELDTDDAKAQTVEVKEPEKKEETKEDVNLNVGEVDLGYTSHDKQDEKAKIQVEQIEDPIEETKPEPKEEKPKEDLGKYTEGVQKRIDKLTYRAREAERREKAATEFAKGLQKKYDSSQGKLDEVSEGHLKEFDARVDAERAQIKAQLAEAIGSQEPNKIMEATDELTRLAVEKEKARIKLAEREALKKRQAEETKTVEQAGNMQAQMPEEFQEPSDKAKAWAQKNEWFGNDRIMSGAAWNVHEDLVSRGVDVESDEYYNQIDTKMREYFPQKFESGTATAKTEARKPVQTVASAGRTQQGRRSVRLTKSQVAIAKKLGVPLEEYAKYVKEEA